MKLYKLYEQVLTEYEIQDYKTTEYGKEDLRAYFNVGGLQYTVMLMHNNKTNKFGEYELSFKVKGQKHAGERQGKDIRHLNNVLYTVMDITEKWVKKYKIRKVKFQGAADEKDSGGFLDGTARTNIYARFLKNNYPNSGNAITVSASYINIDMTKIFPDLFEEGKADKIFYLLLELTDDDKDEIWRTFNGSSSDSFTVSGDFYKKGFGYFELNIGVGGFSGYSISWDIYDLGDEGDEDFNSFNELYNFIKTKFSSNKN